jgi:hypothetical protein
MSKIDNMPATAILSGGHDIKTSYVYTLPTSLEGMNILLTE